MNSTIILICSFFLTILKVYASPTENELRTASPSSTTSHTFSTTPDLPQSIETISRPKIVIHPPVNLFAQEAPTTPLHGEYHDSAAHVLAYAMNNIRHHPQPFIGWLQDQLPARTFSNEEWEFLGHMNPISQLVTLYKQEPILFMRAPQKQRAFLYQHISSTLSTSSSEFYFQSVQLQRDNVFISPQQQNEIKLIEASMRLAIKLNTMSSVILWDAYKSKPANALELQNYAQLIREAYKTYPDAPEFQYRLVACALLALTPNEFWECEGIQQVCANYIQDQNHLSIARGRIASLLHLKFFCAYPEAIHPSWTIMGGHLLGTDYNATTGLVLSACQAVIEKGVKQNFSPIRQYLCEVEQDKTYRHTNKVYHYVLSLLNLMRQDIVSPEDLVDSFFAP